MKAYTRNYPLFSLCGLNCGLCPRYQTDGFSKCPGCGGRGFHLKHPACAVIICNSRHDTVEYCFQCSAYPCARYRAPSTKDSFISYANVITDFEKAAQKGIDRYKKELDEKVEILEYLIKNYNDGRRKNFYCIAVNRLPLPDLRSIMDQIQAKIAPLDSTIKDKVSMVARLFESRAKDRNIDLRLRK